MTTSALGRCSHRPLHPSHLRLFSVIARSAATWQSPSPLGGGVAEGDGEGNRRERIYAFRISPSIKHAQKIANPRLKFKSFNRGLAFGNIGIYHCLGLPFVVEEVYLVLPCVYKIAQHLSFCNSQNHRNLTQKVGNIVHRQGKSFCDTINMLGGFSGCLFFILIL